MKVIICGGGIMGASTAYHLALRGVKSTIVERHELAGCASGKAGGFIEKDWCDGSAMGPLARKGFEMHMAMSKDERFKNCDYRTVDSLSVRVREGRDLQQGQDLPNWMDGSIMGTSVLGSTSTTAQLHPYKLTHAFFEVARELVGTDLYKGTVEGIQMDGSKVVAVKTKEKVMPADIVVIAMGPWSGQLLKWFNVSPVTGYRCHSIVVQPKQPISAHACFVQFSGTSGQHQNPMVYPRPDGTVYVCGMCDGPSLPGDPKDVKREKELSKMLKHMAGVMSSALHDADTISESACFLPKSPDDLPLIGAMPNTTGVYVASGHSCYGIVSSPVTGEAITQLILDGKCTLVDLSAFDPARLFNRH